MTSASTQSTPLAINVNAPAARAAGLHPAAGETTRALVTVAESSAAVSMEVLRFETTRAGGDNETIDSAVSRAHRPTVPAATGTHTNWQSLSATARWARQGAARQRSDWQARVGFRR